MGSPKVYWLKWRTAEQSEFQEGYYIYFRTNTLGKAMKPLILH